MSVKGAEEVAVWRSPGKDRMGDAIPAAQVATLKRCITIPRDSSETQDVRVGFYTIDGFQVYVPPQDVEWTFPETWKASAKVEGLLDTDTIEVRGKRRAVLGTPEPYRNRRGRDVGTIITTKGTEG